MGIICAHCGRMIDSKHTIRYNRVYVSAYCTHCNSVTTSVLEPNKETYRMLECSTFDSIDSLLANLVSVTNRTFSELESIS
jgi:hypothetical protein